MLATATRTSPAAAAANKRRCRFIAGLLRFHSLCNTIARPPPFGMFVLPQNDVGLLTNVNGQGGRHCRENHKPSADQNDNRTADRISPCGLLTASRISSLSQSYAQGRRNFRR